MRSQMNEILIQASLILASFCGFRPFPEHKKTNRKPRFLLYGTRLRATVSKQFELECIFCKHDAKPAFECPSDNNYCKHTSTDLPAFDPSSPTYA